MLKQNSGLFCSLGENADHDSDLTSAFIYFRQSSESQHKFMLKSVKLLEPSPIFIPSLRPLLSSETQYKIVYGKLSYQKGSFEDSIRFCVTAISIKASFDRMAI